MANRITTLSCGRVLGLLALAAVLSVVLPSYTQAQNSSGGAVITSMSGRVSIERSGELWAISAGQSIESGQVIVTGPDGSAQLALPDGSVVEVFPNSRVIFRANQFNLRDLFDIYLGKIRLQIQHLLPGETPLRITSPTAVISVRGTVFEVEVDAAQDTTVLVDSGAVGVRHRLLPGGEVLVQAGETLHVAAALPLTAATRPSVPIRAIGRVVQAVTETWAQINATRGSSGGSGDAGSSGGGVSNSDSGSNETKSPPDDGNGSSGSGDSGGASAPPGDVLP